MTRYLFTAETPGTQRKRRETPVWLFSAESLRSLRLCGNNTPSLLVVYVYELSVYYVVVLLAGAALSGRRAIAAGRGSGAGAGLRRRFVHGFGQFVAGGGEP